MNVSKQGNMLSVETRKYVKLHCICRQLEGGLSALHVEIGSMKNVWSFDNIDSDDVNAWFCPRIKWTMSCNL